MFHGYGSSYIQYCKIFNDLAKEYRIYAIDLPGMGFSSKEGIKLSTYENSLDFFMSTLE